MTTKTSPVLWVSFMNKCPPIDTVYEEHAILTGLTFIMVV